MTPNLKSFIWFGGGYLVISNLVHIPNLKFLMIKGTKTLLILNLMLILILRLFHTTNHHPPSPMYHTHTNLAPLMEDFVHQRRLTSLRSLACYSQGLLCSVLFVFNFNNIYTCIYSVNDQHNSSVVQLVRVPVCRTYWHEFESHRCLKNKRVKMLSCHASTHEIGQCCTGGKCRESITHRRWNRQVKGSNLTLEPRAGISNCKL